MMGIRIVGGISVGFVKHYKRIVVRSHASFLGPRKSVLFRLRYRAPLFVRISEHSELI